MKFIDLLSSFKKLFSSIGKYFRLNENTELPEVTTHWMFESGIFDGFFFLGPKPRDIFKQYTTITGSVPLPPVRRN